MTDQTPAHIRAYRYDQPHPEGFARGIPGWLPWLEPVNETDLTDRHQHGLVEPSRAASAYFRTLVHDPEVLRSRTLTDKAIFDRADDGLPRGEKELAATAASRLNGCVFCAGVHAWMGANFSHDEDKFDRFLAEGDTADLGERWNAIVTAAEALTRTPSELTGAHLERLRAAGLTALEISDLIHASAFFNWANRLMLSLGRAAPAQG